ncbi:hypothetical protein [Natronococcus jeotgali]|uniref:hypothetical protein n=1 Tax=Natronococcus jeotgali TaxID=413812 RepID=UPI0012680E50|nr:hypothetical protein [Natronococcus jeotgali]
MPSTNSTHDIENWEGVLGPQSESEPLFYELNSGDNSVRLVGPSPGQFYDYDRDEFEQLVTEGEWVLAENDPEKEVFLTPDGEQPY